MPRPLGLVVKNVLRRDPASRIPHGYEHMVGGVSVRSHNQITRPIRDQLHRFYAVHHQIDDTC
jgi:hypothetical protein